MRSERAAAVHRQLERARQRLAATAEDSRERHDVELEVHRAEALLVEVESGARSDAAQSAADAMDLPIEGSRENG